MKANICVAIQVKSNALAENEPVIQAAMDVNPDAIELRWDYIQDPLRITEEFIQAHVNLIQPKVPVINTFRSSKEGGSSTIDEEKRIDLITLLIKSKPRYVDIEMDTEKKYIRELVTLANQQDVKVIFSHHDFDKTSSLEEGKKLLHDFLNKLLMVSTLHTDRKGPFTFKLIFTAKKFEDNLIPLRLCKFFSKKGEDRNIISFCMGELGGLSRVACCKFGSCMTYGAITEITAPGQLNVSTLRETMDFLFEDEQSNNEQSGA